MAAADESRPAAAGDAVDGVMPQAVAEPSSGEALAAALARASRERQLTVIRGGATKISWGRTPAAVDLVVSTSRLDSLLVHRDGDLTVTVGAGVPLARLNQALAARGQWLPVDSAFEAATIGGVLATNDAGPLRHRYGTPRDLLIGITLALTDGRVIKAGGTVVKNVAGYDLGKLVTGSFGTLAAVVDATFKLLPVPHASATIQALYEEPATLATDARALAGTQVEPTAIDVRADESGALLRWSLLVRFASSPSAVEAQVDASRRLLRGRVDVVTGGDEQAIWRGQVHGPWSGDAVVRCSWLPDRLAQVLDLLGDLRRTVGAVALVGRAGVGAGLVTLTGAEPALAAAVAAMRASSVLSHVVLLRGSHQLKAAVDVWGPPPESARAAAALKHMFDPAGILNAGRGPI